MTDPDTDRPARTGPPRWKPGDARCYADRPGHPCPCAHDPTPTSQGAGCDHGWTTPIPGRNANPDAARKCATCNAHARTPKEQTDR